MVALIDFFKSRFFYFFYHILFIVMMSAIILLADFKNIYIYYVFNLLIIFFFFGIIIIKWHGKPFLSIGTGIYCHDHGTCRSRVARDPITWALPFPSLYMACQLHSPTFFAIAISHPLINLITSTLYYTCQPCHYHTHGTSPLDRLEIRVIIILLDQTNEAYRSNAVWDLGYHLT